MGIKTYNKLVRDKIPEIIEAEGKIPVISVLNDTEYKKMLDNKLLEEVNEYLQDDNLEEIADVYEVISAILAYKGTTFEDLEKLAQEKRDKRGGFSKKIFLKEVVE